MKIIRLAGLALIAIFTVSLAAASGASATPSFNPATGKVTINGLASTIGTATESATCETNVVSANIASAMLFGPFVIHFLKCTSSGPTKSGCTVKSTNTSNEGLILTNTLHAVLGLVLPSNLPGILILPTSGKLFVTLAGNECTVEAKVNGSVAGLIFPIKSSQSTGKIIFSTTEGKQEIRDIDTLAGLIKPELEAFSQTATETTNQDVEFAAPTEIT
jgi:hypothetical protein